MRNVVVYMKNGIHEGLWSDHDISLKEYQTQIPSAESIKAMEKELGYKFPDSYLEFMKGHNGGLVEKCRYAYADPETNRENEVIINGFLGIGSDKPNTIMGTFGSKFWIEEWEYPDIGIVICDCPSAGHDLVFLDYRECGPEGEPCVSHVDQEADYEITKIADSFEMFVDGLGFEKEEEIETSKVMLHSTPKRDAPVARIRIKLLEMFKKKF